MNTRNYQSADDNVLGQVRTRGGSMTIDFRTDDVITHVVRTLNRLTAAGRLSKTTTPDGLVHTFTLVDKR